MSTNILTASAPPRTWIRVSAWAAVVLVLFQLAALTLLVDDRSGGWSVSTIAQAALVAVLAFGAFRRNFLALALLALFGSWRLVMLLGFLGRVLDGTAGAVGTRVALELVVAIPIALLWIVGGISALRSLLATRAAA